MAPLDNEEDFSTSSLLKNKGSNLTQEYLASLSVTQMLETLLKKVGIIELERLAKVMVSVCKLSKHQMLTKLQLIDLLVNKFCYFQEQSGMFILKSDFKYDFQKEKRRVALRETLIHLLQEKGEIRLSEFRKLAHTNYTEMKEVISELCELKDDVLVLKNYENSMIKG